MEGDCLGLDLSLLHVDLVAAKNDWDVLADTDQITFSISLVGSRYAECVAELGRTVPVGNVLVGDA